MKRNFVKIKKLLAFTLVELIIVIAIVSILAAIVVIFINPSTLFGNGRNGRRGQDLSTYQSSIAKFLADTPPTGSARSLDSFTGMSSLYSSATSTSPYGNCPGLSNGNTSNINGGYLIIDNSNSGNPTNNPNTINIQSLVDNGYLNGVILNPLGNGAYLACVDTTNSNQLVIYDPISDNLITVSKPVINLDTTSLGSITSGSSNGGGASTTTNSTSYNCPSSSIYSNGNCSVIAYTSSTFAAVGSHPDSLAFDSAGNLYSANNLSNNVSKITPSGVVSVFGTTGANPYAITLDSSGNVYTANMFGDNVSKITPLGVSSILGTLPAFSRPDAITIDSSGNLYTANNAGSNVSKITPGGVVTTLGTTGSGPSGIILDSLGNIYTSNQGPSTITKITPLGVSSIFATTGGSYGDGIVSDSSGNFYVVNYTSNNISKITPSGTSSIFGTTQVNPLAISIDSLGNIYTTSYKFTSSGISTALGAGGSLPDAVIVDTYGNVYASNGNGNDITRFAAKQNAVLTISPSTIKVNQAYNLGLNNVISANARVTTGTCSLQVTDTITTTILQTLSGNMNNGACKPAAFNAVTTTHPLSILATISASAQTFTYTTTPQ